MVKFLTVLILVVGYTIVGCASSTGDSCTYEERYYLIEELDQNRCVTKTWETTSYPKTTNNLIIFYVNEAEHRNLVKISGNFRVTGHYRTVIR